MNWGCTKRDGFGMNIVSLDFIRERAFRGFLAIRGQGLSCSNAAKKNSLRHLRGDAPKFLRPEGSACSGLVLWGQKDLFGSGASEGFLPGVQGRAAGEASLVVGQSLLHEEICFCGGEALSGDGDFGRGERVSSRLEDGQGVGQSSTCGSS